MSESNVGRDTGTRASQGASTSSNGRNETSNTTQSRSTSAGYNNHRNGGRTQAGRNQHENNQHQRSNDNSNQRQNKHNDRKDSKPKFRGATESMNGHVFQCVNETNDKNQFTRTVEELLRYARKELTHGNDIAYLLRNDVAPVIKEPGDLASDASESAKYKWKYKMEAALKRQETFTENKGTMYAVILGQCSVNMENELQSHAIFEEINKDQEDCVRLLDLIRSIIYKYDAKVHPYMAILSAKTALFNISQKPHESVNEYKERFDAAMKAVEFHGGTISSDLGLLTYELIQAGEDASVVMKASRDEEEDEAVTAASVRSKDRMKALLFLNGADSQRFGELMTDLHNSFLHGIDQYPANLTKAFDLLIHYKRPKSGNNGKSNGQEGKKNKRGTDRQEAHSNSQNQQGRTQVSESSPSIRTQSQPHTNFLLAHGTIDRGTYGPSPVDFDQLDNSGVGFLQVDLEFLFQMAKAANIPISWILLDSESTVTIIRDGRLLVNIREIPPDQKPLELHTNGGIQITRMVGDLPGYGTVWHNPNSLANVLSLAHVQKLYRVTYDSNDECAFNVHRDDGSVIKFREHKNGLHFYDTNEDKVESQSTQYSFIEMVSNNQRKFTKHQCKQAELARKVLALTGRQNQTKMIKYLQNGNLKNSPVTHEDMQRAKFIYGPHAPSLKGDTVRTQPMRVGEFTPTPLPTYILDLHKRITLCVDVVYIHKLPFLHSISKNIMFRTQQSLDDRHHWTVLSGIKMIINLYEARGFVIDTICADNEFRGLDQDLPGITVNACAADEHVPEIERSNRALKQRIRSTTHALPFRYYPKTLINGIVLHACSWLNAFPNENSVCDTLSPREIVTGRQTDFNIECKVEIGSYCQITEHNDPTNTMDARTRDAIALHPTGNRQGSYYFMAIDTWERVVRHHWKELPMPETIVQVINVRGRSEGRRAVKKVNTFSYEWRPRKPMFPNDDDNDDALDDSDDDSDDESFTPDDHDDDTVSDSVHDDDERQFDPPSDAVDIDIDESTTPSDVPTTAPTTRDVTSNDSAPSPDALHRTASTTSSSPSHPDIHDASSPSPPSSSTPSASPSDTPFDASSSSFSTSSTGRSSPDPPSRQHYPEQPTFDPDTLFTKGGYNLRRRDRPVNLDHLFDTKQHSFLQVAHNPTSDNRKSVVNRFVDYLFTQADTIASGGYDTSEPDPLNDHAKLPTSPPPSIGYSDVPYKKGLQIFGEQAVQAILKEIAQLDDKSVFHAIDPSTLTMEQKREALRALTFVKQKRCGKIKARTCADGRGQRKFYDKAESASPTVSIEGLLLTLAIDAIEGRDVATADIAGAYLNANMDDFAVLKFDGDMVDFVVTNNPDYKQFVTIERGRQVIYMQLDKALYGCLKSAILWYNMLATFLQEEGFVVNPYDMCVANKEINGKQCTICWYVDDLKISHVDPQVVDGVIAMIERKFTKMNVTRGQKHTYVGCDIEFMDNGEVSIDNIEYLKECIEAFGEDVSSHVNTPATRNLMTPKLGSKKLSKEKSERFQSITMKLLWIAKRSRPDLETALSFLCTRNHKSTEDDWGKLKRVLQFVNRTINDKRIISASALGQISMWVDASYAVHEDMRSHTGSVISIGKGTTYCSSSKQKLNVKSSTEGELVGCSDKVPQGIWSKYFLEAQGYAIEKFNLGQDNTSAMLLEENGMMSAGQKSRHINIRYFFIKDRLKQDKITLVHCPTEIMLADYFTKPLQGQLFQKMRNVIMGYCEVDDLTLEGPKECVKNDEMAPQDCDPQETKIVDESRKISWSDVVKNAAHRQQTKEHRKSTNNKGLSNLILLR